jgi:hypothetical protein
MSVNTPYSKIHPDLLKDTERFKVVKNSFEFIKQYASVLESPEHKLKVFLEQTQIDEDYVNELVHNNFEDLLIKKNTWQSTGLKSIRCNGRWVLARWLRIWSHIDLQNCHEIEYKELTETLLISGKIDAYCDVEVFEYNAGRYYGEDQYNSIDERIITLQIYFNFNLSTEKKGYRFWDS